MIAYLIALILVWSYVCYEAGEIATTSRQLRLLRKREQKDRTS